MEERDIYLLITQYLLKHTSTEENEFLADWITASPRNEQTFEEIKASWFDVKLADKEESLKALKKLNHIIDEQEVNVKRSNKKFILKWSMLAATVAVVCMVSLLMLSSNDLAPASPLYLQKVSKAGEIKTFYLVDGTKIILGPKSILKYPAAFEKYHRQVELIGEAYFEVSKNPHKPFTVRTDDLSINVLGTHFNVDASKNENLTAVSLFEGKVNVNVIDDHDEEYKLKPGQELVLNRSSHQVYQHVLDSANVMGWMTKTLVFNNEKLSDAAKKIGKMYGVKLVFDDESTADTRVFARFENDPLNDVLEIICSTGNLSYRNDGNKIYIINKK
ncbi:FecR family protein [Pedobacter jamesrossensis]|uniref:FecR family protein n=1 Tax=Pedobacter jamesrossensis TaxID=1908238 RepID=A0ABV8NJP2_9SPHI